MAGIGFELRKIFGKKTLLSSTMGVLYASITTIGPSLVFVLLLGVLQFVMVHWGMGEKDALFFTSSFTYVFMLAIITSHAQNSVVSRYISDKIFVGADSDICASMFGVLTMNCVLSSIEGIIMCVAMYVQDRIPVIFLVPFYLMCVLSSSAYTLMVYVSAVKEYKKITLAYLAGVGLTLLLTLVLMKTTSLHLVIIMYWALTAGFFVICLSLVIVCVRAFGAPSKRYFEYVSYYKKHWQLIISNTTWIVGFYVTNIIYWFGAFDMSVTVSIFSTAPNYDMAMFLAMLINFSGMVVFEVKTETKVFDKYITYLSDINSGVYQDIEQGRGDLESEINLQLFFSYEVQLIITIVLICIVNIFYPYIGVNTDVLNMFMLLGMGLYCAFCMYFTVIMLYYFDDNSSAMMGPVVFLTVTVLGALICCFVGAPFYPLPLIVGGIAGWIVSFLLLRKRLRNLNAYIMCH